MSFVAGETIKAIPKDILGNKSGLFKQASFRHIRCGIRMGVLGPVRSVFYQTAVVDTPVLFLTRRTISGQRACLRQALATLE